LDFWTEELTPEETENLLQKIATQIQKRKMEVPAVMALEMHKPIVGTLSNASVVFAPFIVPFLGFDNVNDYTRVLSKPENIERLMNILESPREEAKT